jgi:hypothetical protein
VTNPGLLLVTVMASGPAVAPCATVSVVFAAASVKAGATTFTVTELDVEFVYIPV